MNVASRRQRRRVSFRVLATAASLALVSTGCGGAGSVETRELPLNEDFSECAGFTMNDEVATIDCPEGELRVLVAQPEVSPVHVVPFRVESKQQTLAVTAEARAQKAGGGTWGIGCLASEPGEGGRGYLLLVSNEGAAALLRMDVQSEEGGRFAQRFTPLSEQEDVVHEASKRHKLEIRCAKGDTGTVSIEGDVDGQIVVTAEDTPGIAPFTGAVSVVLAEQPGTDIRFDDVNVEGTPEIAREKPHGDQEARIALVRATAEKTPTPYGEVTSVFCQSESPSCVVTYSAPACQNWSVENVNGVDVATPQEFPDETWVGAHGTYSEDNPDTIGCAVG